MQEDDNGQEAKREGRQVPELRHPPLDRQSARGVVEKALVSTARHAGATFPSFSYIISRSRSCAPRLLESKTHEPFYRLPLLSDALNMGHPLWLKVNTHNWRPVHTKSSWERSY